MFVMNSIILMNSFKVIKLNIKLCFQINLCKYYEYNHHEMTSGKAKRLHVKVQATLFVLLCFSSGNFHQSLGGSRKSETQNSITGKEERGFQTVFSTFSLLLK